MPHFSDTDLMANIANTPAERAQARAYITRNHPHDAPLMLDALGLTEEDPVTNPDLEDCPRCGAPRDSAVAHTAQECAEYLGRDL